MFRIKERSGTSFVYHVDTGNLAMIIKSNNKENGVKEEQQVVISSGKTGQLLPNYINKAALLDKFRPSVKLPRVTYCNDDSNDVLSENEFKKRFGTHCNKDLYVPVYDQNSFLKIFDLNPTSAGIPRTPQVDDDDDDPTDQYDRGQQQLSRTALSDVDFTSALGQSILQRKRNCNVFVRDASACVARYDRCCLPTKRSMFPDGLLRDRQGNMVYHVTYVRRTRASGHKYVFNRKQKVERLKVIKTGLNRRARFLKRCCKQVKVRLDRLSEEEIRKWTTRARSGSAPTCAGSSVALSGLAVTSPCVESDTPLQPCIDGTIVIQIDDSMDEVVTVSPKPMPTPGFGPMGSTFRWQDGQLTCVPFSTGMTAVNAAHPIYTNGLTLRAVPQPSSSTSNSLLHRPFNCLKNVSTGPKGSATLEIIPVPTVRPQTSSSDSDDSDDSEIQFLGCVPRLHSAPISTNLASHVPDADTDKVPRFLVTNLCQPTLDTLVASPTRENLNHAATSNGSGQVSSLNRRKIGSPGGLKVTINPCAAKTRLNLQADNSAANNSGSVVVRSTRHRRSFASSNEKINSDFGRLEADLMQLLDRLNRQCAVSAAHDSPPDVRDLAVNFQCHMCGFEEKHFHSAAKRMTRHMDKYHGQMDGVVRLLVNVQVPRNESPPSILVQAVSCDAPSSDHTVATNHTIIYL